MKKILIISYGYPPFNAPAVQRPYALAKYLDKSKYQVTVITCPNADSSLGFDPNFDESLPDVELIKIKAFFGQRASGLRTSKMASKNQGLKTSIKKWLFGLLASLIMPDKAVFWYPKVLQYLRQHKNLIKETDIIFTTSPMVTNHLIGNYIFKRNKEVHWIADFRDYHYVENWSEANFFKATYHKNLEKRILKRAHEITFISSAMQEVYASHYPHYVHKFNFIYNGFDKDNFKDLAIKELDKGPLSIFYAGSFYQGVRSPFPMLSLLDACFEKGYLNPDEVQINIAGNFEQDLLREAEQFASFSCINFLGRIPRTEVLKTLTKTHLLWLIVGDKIAHYTGVPLKFYEYMAARRPIVNFAPAYSEPTKIIAEHQLGVSFEANVSISDSDLTKFKKVVEDYRSGQLNAPLKESSMDMFTREWQANQFQTLFEK